MSGRIFKVNDLISVDEEHGLVCGWAIVCKTLNAQTGEWEDYFDQNVDVDGVHKGKSVPENITEGAVFISLIDIAKSGTLPGNEMHAGDDVGVYAGLFAMTADIAKSMGMTTTKTGLMVQYHPTPEVLAKFKDGTYKGFSIEGNRVEHHEVADA